MSPQSDNWPQSPALDRGAYDCLSTPGSLVLTSRPDSASGLVWVKSFEVAGKDAIMVDYMLKNVSPVQRKVAVWDVMRVPGGTTRFAYADTVAGCGSAFSSAVLSGGHAVCCHDSVTEKQKLFVHGSGGCMTHDWGGLRLTKRFPETPLADLPPHQGELEIFRAPGGSYSELETHGAYRTLAPGDSMHYRQEWHLALI